MLIYIAIYRNYSTDKLVTVYRNYVYNFVIIFFDFLFSYFFHTLSTLFQH